MLQLLLWGSVCNQKWLHCCIIYLCLNFLYQWKLLLCKYLDGSNGDYFLFKMFALQLLFQDNIFLIKSSNINNSINNFVWCSWFGALCFQGHFLLVVKHKYYFLYGSSFLVFICLLFSNIFNLNINWLNFIKSSIVIIMYSCIIIMIYWGWELIHQQPF